MKAFFVVLAVLSSSLLTAASHDVSLSSRHDRHARSNPLVPKAHSKRCNRRNKYVASTSSVPAQTSTTTSSAESTPTPVAVAATNNQGNNDQGNNNGGSGKDYSSSGGLFGGSSSCGSSGATDAITASSGPMGSIDFFNCGIEGGGWNPPDIYLSDLHYVSLDEAIQSPGSPFQACSEYVWIFNKYGEQYGIPPIMMASFALQESTCNPATTGGGGEAGLMQLTSDKCYDAPNGNCYDPEFNIMRATQFFSGLVSEHNGSILEPVGRYNGWNKGMTYSEATAARWSSCCRCQRNLDYLHQFLNGWMQNVNAYDSRSPLGIYFNLNVC